MSELAPSGVIGHVDGAAKDTMSGWAFDPSRPEERLTIEILHEGQPICTLKADGFRADLLESGFGDGRHGFALTLPVGIFRTPTVSLTVRSLESKTELLGSPICVPNHHVAPDRENLQALSEAIHRAVAAARSSEDLRTLTRWLIEHFDAAYQRQAFLAKSAEARRDRFLDLIGGNANLSDVLRQASLEVIAAFPQINLVPVDRPDVSIIIAAFGEFAYTHRCISSIIAHLPKATIEIVLVDDASVDETIYAGLVFSGGIRIIRNTGNLGFLKSSMAGSHMARGEFLLFLNNDTEAQAGWLDEMVDTFRRDSTVGVVGSKLLYPDGRLQEVGGIVWRQGSGCNWGRYGDPNEPRFCFMRDADYVSGAALLIRRSVFQEVGGFSPEFAPAYYEDTDLCFKVRASGRRVVVQPHSRVVHHEGVSSGIEVHAPGAKRFQGINQRLFLNKWFDVLQGHALSDSDPQLAAERMVRRRALFIDDTVPTPDRDAGSNAAIEHMKSLQRIGYKVCFVGADNMAKISPYTEYLERIGIQNYYAPYYSSVEHLLRRESAGFDLIYIHRVMNVARYASLIRLRFPGARIVFNVADLHHLRVEREAVLKDDDALAATAISLKATELRAIADVDSVIVHSTYERDLLGRIAPTAPVYVVPWVVRTQPPLMPFSDRAGIAFIGGFSHTPNVDAAEWLVREVMPLVHAQHPDVECLLIGSQMPDRVRRLEQPGVRAIGHVSDLASALGRLRLTVAPLRYGAGLKGKVITSLASGLPCVATPCAVEGMGLPGTFDQTVATSAADFAACIIRLYFDQELNTSLGSAGSAFIAEQYSEERVDALLATAVLKPLAPERIRLVPRSEGSSVRSGGRRRPPPDVRRLEGERQEGHLLKK